MKISDLRLENLMFGNSIHLNKIVSVKSIKESGFSYNQLNVHEQEYEAFCHFHDLRPIRLTEELLLKCGAYWENILEEKDILVIDITENITIGWCGYLFLMIEGNMVQINNANSEYVHQLQNIYADLSGKELNLKL